ncbi:acetolactate synthase 2 small subunit [Ferrimonas senticii]|uniref:acetolactate synthase 2 small subunit n=1 Tax=Ferrimonas senticii TaxID=394566 RepID=UPI00042A7822|nr:acetolactate synthase 2 small subunit [Ferrimonas senticii]
MSDHTLYIEMNPSSDVMERVLRVTRHRGFTVANMQMQADTQSQQLLVTVRSQRPISQLTRQLDKLIDVYSCHLQLEQQQTESSSARQA